MKSNSRARVLEVFQADPYQSLAEMAVKLNLSAASVSLHLGTLERDGLIKRPRLVRDTSRQASVPRDASQRWASISKKGAIERGEGAMRPRRARDADALQARIDRIVAEAEKGGTCFRADYIKLERLGGCKCG